MVNCECNIAMLFVFCVLCFVCCVPTSWHLQWSSQICNQGSLLMGTPTRLAPVGKWTGVLFVWNSNLVATSATKQNMLTRDIVTCLHLLFTKMSFRVSLPQRLDNLIFTISAILAKLGKLGFDMATKHFFRTSKIQKLRLINPTNCALFPPPSKSRSKSTGLVTNWSW